MRVAALQFKPLLKKPDENLDRIEKLASNTEADLFVLPELCLSGYELPSRAAALALSEDPDRSPRLRRFEELSRSLGAVLVGGFIERSGDDLYNAAFVIAKGKLIGVYRKVHLFGDEPKLFAPGNTGFPVFDLFGGKLRVGVMICFDWVFPEAARSLALGGADLIAHPSNLVLPYAQGAMPLRSLENAVYSVTANRVGIDRRLRFTGASQICDPKGAILTRASEDRAEVISAEVDVSLARDKWMTRERKNHRLDDRRPEQYRTVPSRNSKN